MSEASAAFLLVGLLLSGILAWGFATGRMLSQYCVDDLEETPIHFWISGAVNALLALVCFYMAWVD